MPSPQRFKIVLGITGGIAAYKSAELVRLFVKAGHEVRVMMTKEAEKFIGVVTMHSLSGNPVLRTLGAAESYDLSATSYIDLAKWGDLLVVAPATANFLAKFSVGIADDALLTEALAFTNPILLAPAMNTRMWEAQITQENFSRLQKRNGVHFTGPISGNLACGEVGLGKMQEPEEIFSTALNILNSQESLPLSGKHVLITSGPTRSYIDAVRFITNRSSGRMGYSIALAAEKLGATVTLVTGPVEPRFATLPKGEVISVETGKEMLEAALKVLPRADFVFATAAVADFEPREVIAGKMPRAVGELTMNFVASVDVIGALAQHKKTRQVFFGFAAEHGEGNAEFLKAKQKLTSKKLDFLALNNVARIDIGFDANDNEIYLFSSTQKEPQKIAKQPKNELAEKLLLEANKKLLEL